jgi:hypothetical protein
VWNADGTGEPIELHGHEGSVASAAGRRGGRRPHPACANGSVRTTGAAAAHRVSPMGRADTPLTDGTPSRRVPRQSAHRATP